MEKNIYVCSTKYADENDGNNGLNIVIVGDINNWIRCILGCSLL